MEETTGAETGGADAANVPATTEGPANADGPQDVGEPKTPAGTESAPLSDADSGTDTAGDPNAAGDPVAADTAAADTAAADTTATDTATTDGRAPVDAAFSLADALAPAADLLDKGGMAIWAIAALSIVTLAVILWKIWRLSYNGAWRRARAEAAVALYLKHRDDEAYQRARSGRGLRARVAAAAIRCAADRNRTEDAAREETVRIAKRLLAEARSGLRALELIATVAPLLGLFGTVLGMISAFQQLQASGSRADPSALAGGIWEALLTTAAGMAVAIPASAALTWFESVADRLRQDFEDIATRIFIRPEKTVYARAAE